VKNSSNEIEESTKTNTALHRICGLEPVAEINEETGLKPRAPISKGHCNTCFCFRESLIF